MNKYLHKAMAALMLLCIGTSMWAIEAVDGVYQISSAADLKAFAELVNGGDNEISAVMTADIVADADQPMIGTSANWFKGTFDGQLHKLTLNWTGDHALSQDPSGLFARMAGTVQNLYVDGNVETTGVRTGVVAGRLEGASVIKNVITNVTLSLKISGDTAGSLLVSRPSAGSSEITNCIVLGKMVGENAIQAGGLVGWNPNDVITTITNSAVLATIQVAAAGSTTPTDMIGRCLASNAPIKLNNVYYVNREENTGVERIWNPSTEIQVEDIKSGALTYMLNGDQSSISWYQTIGADEFPSLDPSHGQVYLNGRAHCDGTPYEDAYYGNEDKGFTQDDHNFVDGVCSVCGAADPGFVTIGEDGFYELGTPEQLAWFASKVNAGNPDLNARLTASVDLANIEWTPIGTPDVQYAGTFDGQMYPIYNINGMMFGTVNGAQITGVAIESGTVTTSAGNAHTGGLVGYSPNKETSVTNSYSKVAISGGDGDLGGISGKYLGTLKNVYFAGSFAGTLGTWSMGGLLGSTNSTNTTFISDCFVFADWGEGLDPAYGARGGIVGWCHTNTAYNTYVIGNSDDRLSFTKLLGDGTGSTEGCAFMTADEFASGQVTWLLNGENFANVAWYQTLTGDAETGDPYPTLDATHEIVYPTVDGFASAGADNFGEMRVNLINAEVAYCNNAVANVDIKAAYLAALKDLEGITDRDEFIAAYSAAKTLRADVEQSEKAYSNFIAFVQDIYAKAQESSIGGPDMEMLIDYISNEYEPDADFPNGSYVYILNTLKLTDEQLLAEQEFVNQMWQTAQKNGYKAGDEITNMFVNANLADSFNGWEYTKDGSTFTTGGVTEVMPTAESWNATFDMKQTVSGLTDGFYRLDVNATFRAAGDIYNTNYAAWAYLNSNETLVMTEGEDVVSEENAKDLENCYINGGVLTDEEGNHIGAYDYFYEDADNNIYGYVPYGPLSLSYAFNGGRYVNTLVAEVTDGQLTVGLKLPGTGQSADWMGFGNFRVTYLGGAESDLTADAYDQTLAGMVARANTILAYHGDSGEGYKAKPEFNAQLRSALEEEIAAVATAGDVAAKQALMERFAETFRQIYSCKKAYAAYMTQLESVYNTAWAQAAADSLLAEGTMLTEFSTFMNDVFAPKWENGTYSQEEAEEMAELKSTALYQYLYMNNPAQLNGVYQLASAADLKWLSRMVSMGVTDIEAELTAPIDLTGAEWTPIGNAEAPYTGKFDGHLYPISGINNMLFGTTAGATINGVALVSGEINIGDAIYAPHNGTIIGEGGTAAPTTLTNSYSLVDITSTNGGDIGGLSGKFYGTIDNCFYKGSISGGNTTGGLIGSSSEGSYPANISNSYSFCPSLGAAWYMDGLVGWMHNHSSLTNCYAIASTDGRGFGSNWVSGSTATNCAQKTEAEFASGEVACLLNQGQETPVWFQTLGQDENPVLDNTHLVVLIDEGGNYYNDGSGLKQLDADAQLPATVTVYDMQGRAIRQGVDAKKALEGLPNGLYIIGGKKMLK